MSLYESFDFFEGGIGVAKIAFYLDYLVFFMNYQVIFISEKCNVARDNFIISFMYWNISFICTSIIMI